MLNFVAVGAGAAVGAWLRWVLALAINPLCASFPLGTWSANLIGGFLMGVVLGLMHAVPDLSTEMKLLLTTGFLGGLTTFSSFSGEVFTMMQRGHFGWAAFTVVAHVAGSLFMTALGWWAWQQYIRA